MLAEIDNVVDTLKPQFYSSFVTTDAAAASAGSSSGSGRALSTSSVASFSSPNVNDAMNARTPVLAAYAHAMQSEIDEVVKPVTAASEAFLETYDTKLNALLAQYNLPSVHSAVETDSSSNGGPAPQRVTTTTSTTARLASSSSAEEVVEHRVEGVGSWASSLVTMVAVAAGVALEARRKRAHYSELG
jgi:hypothetical protein